MRSVHFFVVFFLLGCVSLADPTVCSIDGVARCFCSNSTSVTCGDQKGYISNNQTMTSLTLQVVDSFGVKKTVTLENPPGGVRDYYPADNSWVKSRLAQQGVRYESVSVTNFTTDSVPTLYQDANGKSPSVGSGSSKVKDGYDCTALSAPNIIVGKCGGSSCSGKKICTMQVKCSEYTGGKLTRNVGELGAVCKASGDGVCPSPTNCANDPDMAMEEATFVKGGQGEGSRSQQEGGTR